MPTDFVPPGFDVPLGLVHDAFTLVPLGPEHNDRDHRAWMSSIPHIRATPGFGHRPWPAPMTLAENHGDLVRHAEDFAARTGFTYTVLDGDDVIGCVYIYPAPVDDDDPDREAHDGEETAPGVASVRSWVSADRAELDAELYRTVRAWLDRDWPFTEIRYAPR